jgi:transposase-like protein
MLPRIRRRFTEEVKASAVAIVVEHGRSVSRVSADLT